MVVMTVQPIALAILMATEPMPEPPACTRMLSPGSSLALSNSMCCTVAKAIGAHAASRKFTPAGTGTTSRAGMLRRSRADPAPVKPQPPGRVTKQVAAPPAAAVAGAAGDPAIGDDRIADAEAFHARANRADFPGRFHADHKRHLALGERHAAPAPDVE